MNERSKTRWNFSPQQWEAVTNVNQHVLVSAGAGTGKTRTVVGRILHLLGVELEPPDGATRADVAAARCSLREIAAITFTNAAAADLKKKLRAALLDSNMRTAAYDVDLSRIGTIHSFCIDLLREFALQVGANPRDDIVDEATAKTIRSDVVRETVLRVLESSEISNLHTLFERFSAREIREILDRLVGDSDRVRKIAAATELPAAERAMLDMALLAASTLDARLADLELIDFERVIVRARDLLRVHPQVRKTLRRRIKTLIIDEFQDVDPLQKEIAYLLGDPESCRPETTRLMLVGDPKQSIYRFRRADVTVWREVAADFADKGWGAVCSTTRSYRCSKQILGFVDSTIGKSLDEPVFTEKQQDFEVPFDPLTTGSADQDSCPPVELMLLTANDKGKDRKTAERRRMEVAAAAARALALREEGYAWGDMAVVLRSWSMAREYQEAFESVGAPAYPLRTTGFYEQREIVDIQLALETICDLLDSRALLGFLRSPFVGVSDETLLRLCTRSHGPLWDSINDGRIDSDLPAQEAERLGAGVRLLQRLSAMRDRKPTIELLEELLNETGYLAHLFLVGERKDQAIANVLRLMVQARNASRLSTNQYLAYMRQCREKSVEISEPIVPRTDAVTITTTHSAKGLEWRVVFWGGLGLRLNTRESDRVLVGRDTIALRDPGADAQPPNYEQLQSLLTMENLAEEKRLWYVAATRAIERLILCGVSEACVHSNKRSTPADHLLPGLENVRAEHGSHFTYRNAFDERFAGKVIIVDAASDAEATSQNITAAQRSPELLGDCFVPVSVPAGRPRHSATEYLTFSSCPRRHWFKYTLGIREPAASDSWSTSLMDATSRGLIVHDVLERLREQSDVDQLLDDAISRLDESAPLAGTQRGTAYRSHLREEIDRVSSHPDYREIADLPNSRRELPFLFIAGENEYYEGSIDLAATEDDGYVLLDVKTPQCDESVASEKVKAYKAQRDTYVRAVEGIGGMKVGKFAFQFSRANLQISTEVTKQLRERAESFISETLKRIEQGDNSFTDNPSECDFCGYFRVGLCCGSPQKT